jgi:hypothetical protein
VVIDSMLEALDEVRAELGRVGNNLNQMAHGAEQRLEPRELHTNPHLVAGS